MRDGNSRAIPLQEEAMLPIEDHGCLRQVNDPADGVIPALDNFVHLNKSAVKNRRPHALHRFLIKAKNLLELEFS